MTAWSSITLILTLPAPKWSIWRVDDAKFLRSLWAKIGHGISSHLWCVSDFPPLCHHQRIQRGRVFLSKTRILESCLFPTFSHFPGTHLSTPTHIVQVCVDNWPLLHSGASETWVLPSWEFFSQVHFISFSWFTQLLNLLGRHTCQTVLQV